MGRAYVVVSICCPHFEDKSRWLVDLAYKLAAEGHQVKVALAGREACSHIIHLGGDKARCEEWHSRFWSRLSEACDQPEAVAVANDPEVEAIVGEVWQDLRKQPDAVRAFEGYHLRQICAVSLARWRSASASQGSCSEDQQYGPEAAFHRDTIRHLVAYRRLFSAWHPNVVVHFSGHFHQDRAAFLACRELGIPCVAIEGSFVSGHIFWDESGTTGHRGLIAGADHLNTLDCAVPTRSLRSRVHALMRLSLGDDGGSETDTTQERDAVRRLLGVSSFRKVALFLGQVPYDSSVVQDGGAFQDQRMSIRSVRAGLQEDCALVVRLHPKVAATPAGISLTTNCHDVSKGVFVPNHMAEVALLSYLKAADLVVTVNSQSGLQAAWCGLPVVVLGRAFYSGKGFTLDVAGRPEFLQAALQHAVAVGRSECPSSVLSFVALLEKEYLLPVENVERAVTRLRKFLDER